MDKKKISGIGLLLAIVFVGVMPSLEGQDSNHCFIHVDKPFYVTGEVIWYKVYFPVSIKGNDKAIGIGIFDDEGKAIHSSYLRTKGKAYTTGFFKIPFEVKAGVYQLIVTGTNSLNKKKETLAFASIPIYSDFIVPTELDKEKVEETKTVSQMPLATDNPLKIKVALDKTKYRQGEKVAATIIVTDNLGQPVQANLSVSVVDWGLMKSGGQTLFMGNLLYTGQLGLLDSTIRIRGRVVIENRLANGLVLDAYSQSKNKGYYTITDEKGEFSLAIPDFYGPQGFLFRLHFPLLDEWKTDPTGEELAPVNVKLLDGVLINEKKELAYTPEILRYLENSRQRKLIYQLYNTVEAPLEIETPNNIEQEPKPDRFFHVNDYEKFPDLPTFFKEISTPLKFRRENKRSSLTAIMFNPNIRKFYSAKPLFIIDGQLTRKPNVVTSLNIEDIEDIALYFDEDNLKTQFGLMGIGGVVIITTKYKKMNDLERRNPNELVVSGLQPIASLPKITTIDRQEKDQKLPEFRPQIFWKGNLTTDPQGKAEIEYYQSNDIGQFKIEVVVQGKNGEIGWASYVYDVDW